MPAPASLIINSPYACPDRHWKQAHGGALSIVNDRREAGYLWNGARRRFIPDFLVRLANGRMLVLEIKGEDSEQDRAKRAALDVWVKGVNAKGGFGVWCADVAFQPAQIQDAVRRS